MKRWLSIILVFPLLYLVLFPASALASPVQVSASGVITSLSESEEYPAGISGNIRVVSRTIYGSFASGDILGDFVLTYKANIQLSTQSGNFSGTLTTGNYVFKVSGQIQPVQLQPIPEQPGAYVGTSVSTGQWTLKTDDYSKGTFTATIYFVPTPDGHVAYVLPGSSFNMTGILNQ